MELDDVPMLSKDYVVSRQCHLTEEQTEEIKAFVVKIRPEIPVLVIMMKKSNVTDYPNLVCQVQILQELLLQIVWNPGRYFMSN
jgi:hypothetical protein